VIRLPVLAALIVAGCSRDAAPRSAPEPAAPSEPIAVTPPAPAATPAPAACGAGPALRYPAAKRLVAIGDLHGDLAATRGALRAAGAIDDADRWIGGDLVVVQTGDVLDRGDDEQAIVDLLERLEKEAAAAGGALIWLLGNHELMNTAGDFRYVTPGGFADFADAPGVDASKAPAAADPLVKARAAAFLPGGPYARTMGGQAVVAIVGDTVYSHAGVLPAWTSRLDDTNRVARCWLTGGGPPPPALEAQDGPVWQRDYGRDPSDCAALDQALAALGARRMVVGHTPQQAGITHACGEKLWRIDVGMSAHYGGPIQVLLVAGDPAAPRVLTGQRPAH
jgi:hypothetical protein